MLLSVIKGTGKYAKLAMKCDKCVQEYTGRRHTVEKQGDFHRCNNCTRRNNVNKSRLQVGFGEKISKAKKGIPLSEEHKQALRGRIVSDETKLKISNSSKKIRKSLAKYCLCLFECDECGKTRKLKTKTILKLYNLYGKVYCKNCYQSLVGQKTAAKMSAIYSKLYSGDGNFAKKPGVGEKISKAKIGMLLTVEHKKALRKPKSKTDKIREAANRPEERERRSRLMVKRIQNGYSIDKAYGVNEIVKTNKSIKEILCRSKLEKKFIQKIDICDKIKSVESAEYLMLPYYLHGKLHSYLPDFKIITNENQIIFIEIKPFAWADNEETLAKKEVLDAYCKENYYLSVLLTERSMHIWLEQYK